MATVIQAAPRLGIAATCAASGVAQATYYRRRAAVHQRLVSAPVALWAPNALLLAVALVAFRLAAAPPARRRRA